MRSSGLLLLALPLLAGCSTASPSAGADAGATATATGGDGAALGPDGGGAPVGAPCLPYQELSPTFAGFDVAELTVDQGDPACASGVCLVNHFQGRTSCAYGQATDGSGVDAGAGCALPGTGAPVAPDGSSELGKLVEPQCTDRTPSLDVTCSCRCANAEGATDDGASYCSCPSGTVCAQVVPGFVSGDPLAGGYCVPPGSTYHRDEACSATCDATAGNCTETTAALPSASGQATTYFVAVIDLASSGTSPPECLPTSLPVDASGKAECEIYYLLTAGDTCASHPGLTSPDPAVAAAVIDAMQAPTPLPVCLLPQLPATPCGTSSQAGWCYLSADEVDSGCPQTIAISPPATPPNGVLAALACP
ncbi:MAG: hypothetical protein ABSE49_26375 [Polyangiaceae bacterium]